MTTFFCDDCGKPFKAKVTGIFCPACCRKRNGYKFGEWIPVTEKLPDWRDGKVLVFTKYGFSLCERTVNGRWKGQHANWITHWMPLPEPPEERKNNEGN